MTLLDVVVKFPDGVLPEVRGDAMRAMEQVLWKAGVHAAVLQAMRPDDSKLRSLMTLAEREKL